MNDDWFWLYAGVAATTNNANSIIISNDQMRDHHFNMLSMKYTTLDTCKTTSIPKTVALGV